MGRSPAVLVVDDDVGIAEMVCEFLELGGVRASSCHDAAQAFIQAEALQPALIITDVMMPAWGTGADACRRIRSHPRLRDIPVIFMTSLAPEEARKVVPVGEPLTGLVHKPLDLRQLASMMTALTRGKVVLRAKKADDASPA